VIIILLPTVHLVGGGPGLIRKATKLLWHLNSGFWLIMIHLISFPLPGSKFSYKIFE
jgi:hypothetical protein